MTAIILGALVVLVVIAGIILLRGSRADVIEERLDQLGEFTSEFIEADTAGEAQRASARDVIAQQLDRAVAGRGFAEGMRSQLRKADLKLTVGEFMILHLVTFALGGLAGYAIWGSALLAALAAFAGLFAPRIYIGIQRNQRLKAFNNQLADILNLWVNALRSGYSVLQAIEAIGREAPPPASEEFSRVVQEVQLGIPMETALNNMLKRVESEDLDMVFTAVAIQREVGGNLAEILDVISHTIRERVRIKGEIQTLTAQGRITGYIISGLPIILTLFLYAINKQYMSKLFVGPPWIVPGTIPCGWPIIGLGLVMIAVGAAIIRRIVDIEV
jgi:tight adherence protein B